MTDPWNFAGESTSLSQVGGTLTLVEGSSFCISGRSGDMVPGSPHGLFFQDTRFLSRLQVEVNDVSPEPLAAAIPEPFSAVVAARARPTPGKADSHLMVFRSRWIGRGMREDIEVRNFGDEPAYCSLVVKVDTDFANLFEVKEGRATAPGDRSVEANPRSITYRTQKGTVRRGVHLEFGEGAIIAGERVTFEVIVPASGSWSTCIQVAPIIDEEPIEPRYKCGEPVDRSTPVQRLARWRQQIPILQTDHEDLREVVSRSAEDLGALRIFDPDHPERAVIAAGAPWFMTLFGRDSLITSWFALIVDPDLALGVLQTLARFQGEKEEPRNDEEPGRILHEMRFGESATLSLGSGRIYYGTADATPLFVMLLGELRRWGLAREAVDQLLPHADRAIEWIENYGDKDGDGYVEYQRSSDRGLQNQGWKDSWDGIRYANGDIARAPIALAEVQAYVYSAYLARAHFATEAGDMATAALYKDKAAELKRRFNQDFWLPDKGWFAVGLDQDKRPIDSLTSNMGHCLWTGIVDTELAAEVADRLIGPDLFTGWGIRTLGRNMGGYNPISYHCGSVWPHDNAIAAAGLMRYGFVEQSQRLMMAMIDAAMSQGARLPELFAGLDRHEFPTVVSYPTSCSPQAWAAASPLLFLRTMLRFDPWVPYGKVWLSPALPEEINELRLERIPLAGGRVTVEVSNGNVKAEGLPPNLELMTVPRDPLTAG
jgi:glycogen debranching enzyme